MKKPTYTAEQIAAAVTEAKGLISVAARRVGCDPRTIRNFAKKHKMVADAIFEAKEALKDFAESRMYKGIEEGNPTLLIFYLKTQAKDRGYIETERKEITGAGGGALKLEYETYTYEGAIAGLAPRSVGNSEPSSDD